MPYQAVQVGVRGSLDVKVSAAYVVDGLVVHHEGAIRVLQRGVRREDGVVGLDHGRSDLRSGVDGELQLGFLTVVYRETFHQERCEAGPRAAAERAEHQKPLQTGTLVREFTDSIRDLVNECPSDGVVSSSVVVGGIFLSRDELLGMEQLAVSARSHLVDDAWFQVDENSPRHVFSRAGLAEERVERVVRSTDRLIGGHQTIGLNAVLEAVQFPARVTHLATGLADMDGDDFSHFEKELREAEARVQNNQKCNDSVCSNDLSQTLRGILNFAAARICRGSYVRGWWAEFR